MVWPSPSPGRAKGSKNKRTLEVEQRLARLNYDPVEGMARITMGQSPCPTCDGALRARYAVAPSRIYLDPDKGEATTCRTCWGTGQEPIRPELRGKMVAELAQYVAPKRKTVEHTSPDRTLPAYVIMGVEPDATSEEWECRNNLEGLG